MIVLVRRMVFRTMHWPGKRTCNGQRRAQLRNTALSASSTCYQAVFSKIVILLCAVLFTEGVAETRVDFSEFSRDALPEFLTDKVDYSCGRTRLCNSSLGSYGTWRCTVCEKCYCDERCFSHGDCCVDKYLELPAIQDIPDFSSFVSCSRPFPNHQPLFAVVRCPVSYDQDGGDVDKCERPDLTDIKQATLVTDLTTNMTFRNEFCARCHDVQNTKAWRNEVSCKYSPKLSQLSSKAELWTYVIGEGNCNITAGAPDDDLMRPCVSETVRTCNNSGNWAQWNSTTERLCQNLYSPIMYIHPTMPEEARNQWYHNVFCLECNGVDLTPRFPFCRVMPRKFTPKPLSVLMDFNREDLLEDVTFNQTTCDIGTVMDPFSGICKKTECSERRLMVNKDCSPRFSAAQWLGYSFSVTMTTSKEKPIFDWSNISNTYEDLVREVISDYAPYAFAPITLTVFVTSPAQLKMPVQRRFHSFLVEARVVSSSNKSSLLFEQRLRSLQTKPWVINSDVTLYPQPSACRVNDSSLSVDNRRSFSTVFAHDNEKCDEQCFKAIEYTDIETILDCPYVIYNMTQSTFTVDKERNEITFSGKTTKLNTSDYYVCGDRMNVCIDVLDRIGNKLSTTSGVRSSSAKLSQERKILGSVSFACSVLSLVALLLTFVTYSILPKLRTLPGKNTMALVFHLFLAQLTFLVGNSVADSIVVCQIMGILTHYFWLATFSWMAVCAYHMYTVFTDLLASRHHSITERTSLVRFSLGANLSSLAVVLACLAYHLITSTGTETGYGGANCFILNPIVQGVSFAAPICIVLLCNVFFFIRTVLSIRNIPNMKNSTHNSNRRHVSIYFRLSVLMGFTWIFAFVQEIKGSIYLEYLFVIFTGCQGLFIFVAFCLNRRTCNLLREKFSSSSSKHNSSSTPKTDSTDL